MNILHFSLGLPPYRSGGLTKYATDLMVSQQTSGLNVSLLYPGDFTFWKIPKMYIDKPKDFLGVKTFEIKNPPPVPLLHGVSDPSDIFNASSLDTKALAEFYDNVKPDVFHVHTLMGLPLSVLNYFKEKGVKLVFTTHDYYGLCPKVNFINRDNELCKGADSKLCAACNCDAKSTLFLKLRNSKYLLRFKKSVKLKKQVDYARKSTVPQAKYLDTKNNTNYEILINYYKDILNKFNSIHFNSHVTAGVYKKYILNKVKCSVIPITHNDITDNRQIKSFNKERVRFTFIGSTEMYKGFPILKEALKRLAGEGINNWELNVFGETLGVDLEYSNIKYKGRYSSDELKTLFSVTDLLIVPSLWKETFSFITLEALSFGVPVLVTESVGAKDIVRSYKSDFVIETGVEALLNKLKLILNFKDESLKKFNEAIINSHFQFSMSQHLEKINNLYKNFNE